MKAGATTRAKSESSGRMAVIGAGTVGSTIAYAAMLRGLVSGLVLIDTNRSKCEAEVKDLNHGLRFIPSVRVSAGTIADCAGCDIVVITAGAKQKPGQSRLDLVHTNVQIFREMIPAISAAAPEAILLVVSNPVDVLTTAAVRWHPGGSDRVFGSGTVLDSSRLVTLIAERVGISVANVHAQIVGEHGESEIPLWSSAYIGNMPLKDFEVGGRRISPADQEAIIADVRSAAGEIIAAKGATNWAIGLATARILEAIRRDENAVLTVSRMLQDYHGVSDVCLSVPSLVHANGVGAALNVPMNSKEIEGLRASAEVVRQSCREAGVC